MRDSIIEQFACVSENRFLGTAEVMEVDSTGQRVRLRLAGSEDDIGVWATIAIAAADVEICERDRVLVIGEDPSELYVIGLLGLAKRATKAPKKMTLSGGSYATAAGVQDEKTLRVFSNRDELLFEYDEANHRARVNVACGDLEFVTANGNIAFSSSRDVLIQGQSVRLSSASTIKVDTTNTTAELSSHGIELRGPEVKVSAERGSIQLQEAALTGNRLFASFREGKFIVDRFESIFQTLTEKARNAFRTVEQLSQLRAARVRTLVESTYFFKARKAFIKSEEDYKIRAEKIHLG